MEEIMESGIRLDSILEKQKKRYGLLLKIYQLTGGDEAKILMLEAPEEFDPQETQSIILYLAGEGLVQSLADEAPLLRITHAGVIEVEESLLNPKQSTEHFMQQVIQHFHGAVGSVQTGNRNVANIVQNLSSDPQILALLEELRGQIVDEPIENHQQGLDLLEGLELEVKAESQSKPRMKLFLDGLATFVKDAGQKLLVEIGLRLLGS